MAPRSKRRRLSDLSDDLSDSEIYKPATLSDKESWNGFCEIESEPVSGGELQMRRNWTDNAQS